MTTLLSMSLGGSVLILITLLMRPIIRNWCSGRAALMVWSLSVIRLVCPLFLPVYMSFYSYFTVTGNPYTPEEIINDFSVASAKLPLSRLVIEPYFSGKIKTKFKDGRAKWCIPYKTQKGTKYRYFANWQDCKKPKYCCDKIPKVELYHSHSRSTFEERLNAKKCEL